VDRIKISWKWFLVSRHLDIFPLFMCDRWNLSFVGVDRDLQRPSQVWLWLGYCVRCVLGFPLLWSSPICLGWLHTSFCLFLRHFDLVFSVIVFFFLLFYVVVLIFLLCFALCFFYFYCFRVCLVLFWNSLYIKNLTH
jgi:hypothetical protein